jgi:AcrR family transcriptional regulator
MTENANLVIESERMVRVLDAAAGLLVRLSYRRVTIDDVARAAGVGKGTVYLHFPNKEALFITVLLREQREGLFGIAARMRDDPAEVLPARMMGSAYRRLAEDPVARAVYLGDPETFGRLAQEAAGTLGELSERRDAVFVEHLRLLREVGLVRTDLTPDAQHYLLSATSVGFYLLGPDSMPAVPEDPGARADLLEYAIASVLQTGTGTPTPELAATVAGLYESLITHIDQEWRRRVR